MLNEISSITKHLFSKENPDDVEIAEIEHFIAEYPYYAPARVLLAKKLHGGEKINDAAITAGLFVHNPLRMQWLLNREEKDEAAEEKSAEPTVTTPAAEPSRITDEKQVSQSTDDSPIVFQSYHTIDYFASQGIRLQASELTKDKLGQQLKSFTDWLRSMKKLPTSESEVPEGAEDTLRHSYVMQSAAHSIEAREVLTEAMAEVWARQGKKEKAIAIYEKLSLQNPAKSDYFAAKTDQLKAL